MEVATRYSASTRIRAPIDAVFDYFADRKRYPRSKALMSLDQLPPGPVGLGTVFKVHYHRRNIDVLWTVDEFEPPRRVRFRVDWPGEEPMFEGYTLDDIGAWTTIRHEAGLPVAALLRARTRLSLLAMRPLYALLAPLGLWMQRRRVERDFRSRDIARR